MFMDHRMADVDQVQNAQGSASGLSANDRRFSRYGSNTGACHCPLFCDPLGRPHADDAICCRPVSARKQFDQIIDVE
jgi:hypothetical protein